MLIYLIGFMGSGKTSTAKRLANKLGYKFMDMDDMLEKEYHISINDLFTKYDEETFRKLEQKVLYKTFSLNDCVISTGGGTPCYSDNMEKINEHGISVYLKMDPKMLYNRLNKSLRPRPLLLKVSPERRMDYIETLLEKRERYYLQAKNMVDGKNIDISNLIKLLSNG